MFRWSSTTRMRPFASDSVIGRLAADRQTHREGGSPSRVGAHLHLPVVVFHDSFYHREPQAGPLGLGGEERFEDARRDVARNALSLVADVDAGELAAVVS